MINYQLSLYLIGCFGVFCGVGRTTVATINDFTDLLGNLGSFFSRCMQGNVHDNL
jgi:hypothetical protein